MRWDVSFAVSIFAVCTYLMGILLRQTLIMLFCEWDIEPFPSLVFVLNMFALLPFFGLLTYIRQDLLGNYSLPFAGYFVWVSPLLFAAAWACSTALTIPATYISWVFGGLFGVAIVITYRSIDKQRRELETDHGGL